MGEKPPRKLSRESTTAMHSAGRLVVIAGFAHDGARLVLTDIAAAIAGHIGRKNGRNVKT
jgi:hypothetical protein